MSAKDFQEAGDKVINKIEHKFNFFRKLRNTKTKHRANQKKKTKLKFICYTH